MENTNKKTKMTNSGLERKEQMTVFWGKPQAHGLRLSSVELIWLVHHPGFTCVIWKAG